MMCAAKIPFTLFLYDLVEKDDLWVSDYFSAKSDYIKDYDTPLWNLPFCVDRKEKRIICQTNAVFAHVGRACGMFGDKTDSTESQCEELLCEIYDLRNIIVNYAYQGGDVSVDEILTNGKKHLTKLEACLEIQSKHMGTKKDDNGNNGSTNKKARNQVVHLVNNKFTAPDFHLYEMLDQFEALASSVGKDIYDGFFRLKEFKEGFASLEENQFYLNSWLHKDLPFNNCMAKFGSLPGPKVYVHGESSKHATWRGKGIVQLSPP